MSKRKTNGKSKKIEKTQGQTDLIAFAIPGTVRIKPQEPESELPDWKKPSPNPDVNYNGWALKHTFDSNQ